MDGKIVLLGDDSMSINQSSLFISKLKRSNYTPFGTEFKKIIPTQLSNYGTNFGVEIPVVGNVLYRGFLEVDLPILAFYDSIITDIRYVQYKSSQLSNITAQIQNWQLLYNTMKSFSNIMLEVYVDVKKILLLQNITLSFLQSRVLNIINKYGEDLYKYRLLIDTNILNNIEISLKNK